MWRLRLPISSLKIKGFTLTSSTEGGFGPPRFFVGVWAAAPKPSIFGVPAARSWSTRQAVPRGRQVGPAPAVSPFQGSPQGFRHPRLKPWAWTLYRPLGGREAAGPVRGRNNLSPRLQPWEKGAVRGSPGMGDTRDRIPKPAPSGAAASTELLPQLPVGARRAFRLIHCGPCGEMRAGCHATRASH